MKCAPASRPCWSVKAGRASSRAPEAPLSGRARRTGTLRPCCTRWITFEGRRASPGRDLGRAMPERELDERFHLNLEDIKDFAIFRVDPEGRIASWNTGAERVKGYTAEEVVGQPFAMLFTQEDRDAGRPELEMRVA